jgi:hypothetical protein
MNRSIQRCLAVPCLAFVLSSLCVACSSPEKTLLPSADGWGPAGGVKGNGGSSSSSGSNGEGAGGGSGSSSGSSAGSTSSGSSSGSSSGPGEGSTSSSSSGAGSGSGGGSADAGGPQGYDAGGPGFFIDSGGTGATPTPSGPLGSCGNPLCGTDLTECGCQATDSAGNTVQLGCQAGGQCICLINNNANDAPFDENGACNAQASTVAAFLANCTCQ